MCVLLINAEKVQSRRTMRQLVRVKLRIQGRRFPYKIWVRWGGGVLPHEFLSINHLISSILAIFYTRNYGGNCIINESTEFRHQVTIYNIMEYIAGRVLGILHCFQMFILL